MFHACASGQQIKCLPVIDEFTRECLVIDVAGSIRSSWASEVLTRLISKRGAPRFLRSDNGPEFVSHAILDWFAKERIDTAHIVIETWRRHYNHIRPHSSLKDLTPIEFKTRYDAANQGAALNF